MSSLHRRAFLPWFALSILAAAANAGEPTVGSATAPIDAVEASNVVDAATGEGLFDATADSDAEHSFAPWLVPEDEKPTRTGIDEEGYYRNLYRRFTLSLGGAAYVKFNTSFQISGSSSVGADLDGEDLLGLDEDSVVGRLDANYAFNRRHWLTASYYDIRREGERVIPDDIQVGDVVIPAGPVETDFDTGIIKLAYRYNFVTDPRTVIGASFGFHMMQIDVAVKSQSFNIDERFKVNAPLPLLGLHGAYALSEKWRLSASGEFLQFDIGDYRGLITDVRLTLDHDTFEHFGWGFGFNSFQSDAEFKDDNLTSDIEYGYQGLMLYARMLF